MKARLMAVGGFILGLGAAMIFGSLNLAELASAVNSGASSNITSISYDFIWAGFVLFPVGLAILAYGVGAQKSSPEIASTETGI